MGGAPPDELGDDVPGRDESLFDARVTSAFAHATLDAREEGRRALAEAVAEDPPRAERDARYLFVKALLEDRLRACIPLYQRAVELDPRFEAAQFQLARHAELGLAQPAQARGQHRLGDLRPVREGAQAQPGQHRLLGEHRLHAVAAQALQAFRGGGRAFRRPTGSSSPSGASRAASASRRSSRRRYVADLDHGLARIAAERGQFELAYRHYHRAVSAILSQGWAARSFADYHFDRISWAILRRFDRYKETVKQHHRYPSVIERSRTTPWLRDSVLSFVLYDYSEACFRYFLRTHDYVQLEKAYVACAEAIRLNDQFVLAIYLRYQLEAARAKFVGAPPNADLLKQVEELVPAWPEAAHKLLRWRDEQARAARKAYEEAEAKAESLVARARTLGVDLNQSIEGTLYDESVSLPASVEEPARLIRKADKLTAIAKARRTEEAAHEAEARKLARTLLPHSWLWDKNDAVAWRSVSSGAARRELRWERRLEPFHVSVLVAWCRFIADREEGAGRVDDLLDLIERRFLPSNLELIKFRVGRPAANSRRLAVDYGDQIEKIVQGLLTSDESTFVALKELDVTSPAAKKAFAKVAAMPELSPYLYHWLGKQLLEYWKETDDEEARKAALLAYEGAYKGSRRIEQPEALLRLADEVADLGETSEREELYRAAANTPGGSLRELEQLIRYFDERKDFARVVHLLGEARSQDTGPPEIYGARVARAHFVNGQFEHARDELAMIPADGGALGPDWRFSLSEQVMKPGDDTALARLRDWLGAQQRAALADGSEAAAKDAAMAALNLAHTKRRGLWSHIEALEDESRLRLPIAQPIVVEGHREFFPQGGDTPAVRRLTTTDIPTLRRRIQNETGVFIPGFRLRVGGDLPERGYRVRLHGVTVMEGTIAADRPDVYGELMQRADDAIHARLSTFVDLQSVFSLLRDRRIDDERRLCAFTSLLRRLVEAGVPINDVDVLLDACEGKELHAEELPGIVHEIQRRIGGRVEASPPPVASKKSRLPLVRRG